MTVRVVIFIALIEGVDPEGSDSEYSALLTGAPVFSGRMEGKVLSEKSALVFGKCWTAFPSLSIGDTALGVPVHSRISALEIFPRYPSNESAYRGLFF